MHFIIFGAAGNLGKKLTDHLKGKELTLIFRSSYRSSCKKNGSVKYITADASLTDGGLRQQISSKNPLKGSFVSYPFVNGVINCIGHCPPKGNSPPQSHHEMLEEIERQNYVVQNIFNETLPLVRNNGCFVFMNLANTLTSPRYDRLAMSCLAKRVHDMRIDVEVVSRNIKIHLIRSPLMFDSPYCRGSLADQGVSTDEVCRGIISLFSANNHRNLDLHPRPST